MSRIHDKLSATIIKALKSIFARHGIPIELIADNMPFDSLEFKHFANGYMVSILQQLVPDTHNPMA